MNDLAAAKAQLVDEITELMTAHADWRPAIVDHEPATIAGFTITVATSGYLPDRIVLTIRIYADLSTAATGQEQQDQAIALLSDELTDEWSEPQWRVGWDDRTEMFIAEGETTYLRAMV